MFKRVLLCYDGSDAGRRALKRGAKLAILLGAQVHVLSIIPSAAAAAEAVARSTGHACLVDDSQYYGKLLDESLQWLKTRGVIAEGYLAAGDTLDQIAAYAKRLAVDLIVLGHYPQPAGGFWWSSARQRASLTERVGCCVFVAVSADDEA
jgi:nucleotide-binding universal stress UspA family protein